MTPQSPQPRTARGPPCEKDHPITSACSSLAATLIGDVPGSPEDGLLLAKSPLGRTPRDLSVSRHWHLQPAITIPPPCRSDIGTLYRSSRLVTTAAPAPDSGSDRGSAEVADASRAQAPHSPLAADSRYRFGATCGGRRAVGSRSNRALCFAGLPQLVGIFVCRDSRFACKSRGEVAARGEIL